uniref:Uncharacterized protein n=1 Tax=Anguilla anguilla TaxID=7936 RepID=A0A0E9RGP9_ANGAN
MVHFWFFRSILTTLLVFKTGHSESRGLVTQGALKSLLNGFVQRR